MLHEYEALLLNKTYVNGPIVACVPDRLGGDGHFPVYCLHRVYRDLVP